MNKKAIITYVMGIASGVILTLLFAFYIGNRQNTVDTGVNLFDNPQKEVKADEFTVIQVLPNGNALATYNKLSLDDNYIKYGTVVMFLSKQKEPFYDDQQIKLPKRKIFRQIGTYRYQTAQGIEKTVPIVDIFDK